MRIGNSKRRQGLLFQSWRPKGFASKVNQLDAQSSTKLPSQPLFESERERECECNHLEERERREPERQRPANLEEEIEVSVQPPDSTRETPKSTDERRADQPKAFPKTLPPFPSRLAKNKKEEAERDILEVSKKVEVNIPLLDAIRQVPRGAPFLKDLCTNKKKLQGDERLTVGEKVSALLRKKLPPNLECLPFLDW
jgi:hypothetical protein